VKSILDPPDPAGNETAFRNKVKALFEGHGWLVSHTWARPAKGKFVTPAAVGFPDLILLRPPSLVALECKSLGKSATEAQRKWLNGLDQVPGVEAYCVNPGHWPALVDLARNGCATDERVSDEQSVGQG
jgi:hypothetical protein